MHTPSACLALDGRSAAGGAASSRRPCRAFVRTASNACHSAPGHGRCSSSSGSSARARSPLARLDSLRRWARYASGRRPAHRRGLRSRPRPALSGRQRPRSRRWRRLLALVRWRRRPDPPLRARRAQPSRALCSVSPRCLPPRALARSNVL